jgi:hypothetical protein
VKKAAMTPPGHLIPEAPGFHYRAFADNYHPKYGYLAYIRQPDFAL